MSYSGYSYQNNNYLQVYEFSREFIDVSEINGRWVSGGYGDEVGKSNHPVPEQIKAAVEGGDFRINDNYPPKENEYALIGREIDKYSVLAVATLAGDDKVRRMIAYRYFWLEKPAYQDIDGVGTLLDWWLNIEEPKFDFQWESNNSPLNYKTTYYSREESYQYFEKYKSHVQSIINQINYYPFVFQKEYAKSRNGLHYLALYLNKKYGTPIAWAWNVGWLEKPQRLTLICCSDETSYKNNSSYIQKHKRPFTDGNTNGNTHQSPSPQPNTPNSVQSRSSSQPNVPVNNQVWDNIKQCLLCIATNHVSDPNAGLQELADYIEKYPIKTWNWDRIIEQSMMDNPHQYCRTNYRALLVILGYRSVPAWLNKIETIDDDSLELQRQLLQICGDENKVKALKQLKRNMNIGIIELLEEYDSIENQPKSTINETKLPASIQKILCSKNLWSEHFHCLSQQMNQISNSIASVNSPSTSSQTQSHSRKKKQTSQLVSRLTSRFITIKNNIKLVPQKPLILGVLILVFLGVIVLREWPKYENQSSGGDTPKTEPANTQKTQNLGNYLESYIKNNDSEARENIKTSLQKLVDESTNMRKGDEYKWVKTKFINQIDLEYPSEGRNYITKVQTILNEIGYPVGKVDGQLGGQNSKMREEYYNFQNQHKQQENIDKKEIIKDSNPLNQGPTTWNALVNKLTDKQVSVTAEFLLTKIDKPSTEFNQYIQELEKCQTNPSLEYINCVNSLKNQRSK